MVFGLCGEIVEAGADKANHNLVPSLSVQLDPIQHRKYKKDENVGQIHRCVQNLPICFGPKTTSQLEYVDRSVQTMHFATSPLDNLAVV